MKLLTKEIQEKAESQFKKADDMDQKIVAKFFNPVGDWSWYLMNKDPKSGYCWGIVDGFAVEMGSFMIEELQNIELPLGLGIERDISFQSITAKELWNDLHASH